MTGEREHSLRDSALEDEIELLGEVIAGAAHASKHLSDTELDEILGVQRSGPSLPYDGNWLRTSVTWRT